MLGIVTDIQTLLNAKIVDHEQLNDNSLYLKIIENNMIKINAYYKDDPLMQRYSIDEIYAYPVMDEDSYEVETTELGIAVYQRELEERRIVALYDAKNNQSVKNLSSNEWNQFILYHNSLEGIKRLQK